jgi:small-conductance mechanosensitive channel
VQLGNLDLAAMDIIAFVGTVYVATLLSRFVRFVLDEEVFPRVTLGRGLPSTISVLANYIILTLGFFIAISVAGIDLSRLTIVLGALSVGIGFGLQNVVNNFVSGLILVFERPIQVGDTIEVGQLLGHVKRIGFRSSTVRTYDGAEVIVPNGNLISSEVVNWTLSDRNRRLVIPVGVAYGSDPEQVLEILNATVMDHQSVLKYPKPVVIFTGFGDSALQFSVRVWVSDFEESFRITSDLSVMIYAALNKAGIEIPFPQRDLHLRSVAPGISLSAPAKGMPGDESAEKSAD